MTITRNLKNETALILSLCLDCPISVYVLIWRKDCVTFQIIFHITRFNYKSQWETIYHKATTLN